MELSGRDNPAGVDEASPAPPADPAHPAPDARDRPGASTRPPTSSSLPSHPPQPAAHPPRRRFHWLKAIIKWGLCLAVVLYVGRRLFDGFAQINWHTVHFHPVPLLLSCAAFAGMFTAQLFIYRQLIKAYARPISWRAMIPVAWLSAPGKYLPGGFAAVAGKMYLLNRLGVSGTVAFSLAVLQDGMAAVAGLLVAAPLLDSAPVRALWQRPGSAAMGIGPAPANVITVIAVLVVGAVCLHPRVFAAIANVFLRRLKRPTLRGNLTAAEYAGPLLGTFAQWFFAGVSLWFMVGAIHPIALSQLPFCTAACALAMTIGYLALFAPAGLGVRDGILLALLSPLIGVPSAALTVLAFRVAQIVVEVLLAGVGAMVIQR